MLIVEATGNHRFDGVNDKLSNKVGTHSACRGNNSKGLFDETCAIRPPKGLRNPLNEFLIRHGIWIQLRARVEIFEFDETSRVGPICHIR